MLHLAALMPSYIDEFPKPDDLIRRFVIIGSQIFSDEEVIETFVKEEKSSMKSVKLGRLNNGFTLFTDHNYSTRLIIRDRKIQGIELFIHKDDTTSPIKLEIPSIYEKKFNKPGSIETLLQAFNIPDELPDENEGKEEKGLDLTTLDIYTLLGFFISILNAQAWIYMGLRVEPGTDKTVKDLERAKTAIDCISCLIEKLEPHINSDEKRKLKNLLSDLQINFVRLKK